MNQYQAESYDVIVVGAGHAGSEAKTLIKPTSKCGC